MKAVIFDGPGDPRVLHLGDAKKPSPGENELLVKVNAAGINRADTLQRMGKYPPPAGASPLLGLEISGEVEQTGSSVVKWKRGDKVFGLIPGGGYAEFAVINQDMAMPVPEDISMLEAAAIPEVFLTAYQALVWYGRISGGEFVLIHAGASGVGTAAIQIVREFEAHPIVTASRGKHKICNELGAELAIDYKTDSFDEKVSAFTGNKGADIIIDFIAGPYFKKNIDSLNIDGRLIILATLGGGKVDDFDLRKILAKRISVIGSTLRSRSLNYQIKLTGEFRAFALNKFQTGKIKPVIDKVFSWKEAAAAHEYMEANKNAGKILLEID